MVELVNLFLLTKSRAGKSERYLRALRYTLKKFVEGRAHRPADEITVAQIEDWLDELGLEPRTQKGYLGDLRTLYNFGIKRGLLRDNPARGAPPPVAPLANSSQSVRSRMPGVRLNVAVRPEETPEGVGKSLLRIMIELRLRLWGRSAHTGFEPNGC